MRAICAQLRRRPAEPELELFTCTCDWVYVVGRREVFGPMFRNSAEDASRGWHVGRMMTREQWADEYADCAYRLELGLGARQRAATATRGG